MIQNKQYKFILKLINLYLKKQQRIIKHNSYALRYDIVSYFSGVRLSSLRT